MTLLFEKKQPFKRKCYIVILGKRDKEKQEDIGKETSARGEENGCL